MSYEFKCDRIRLSYDGTKNGGRVAELRILNGWNDNCDWSCSHLSFEEMQNLRHALDRAIDNYLHP